VLARGAETWGGFKSLTIRRIIDKSPHIRTGKQAVSPDLEKTQKLRILDLVLKMQKWVRSGEILRFCCFEGILGDIHRDLSGGEPLNWKLIQDKRSRLRITRAVASVLVVTSSIHYVANKDGVLSCSIVATRYQIDQAKSVLVSNITSRDMRDYIFYSII